MFSDNPQYTMKQDSGVQASSLYEYQQARVEQRRHALRLLAGVIPNTQTWVRKTEYRVTGADYWKYFKCPLIASLNQLPPNLVLAAPSKDGKSSDGRDSRQQPTHRTIGVQTVYRESETQTNVFNPDYVIKPGTSPWELLQLAVLTWGNGLPAGLAEVEMIERLREKRAWEATLPPINDQSQFEKRRRMMEEQEAKEWAFRESEIEKLQEDRLAVMTKILRQKEQTERILTIERLNNIYAEREEKKVARLKQIHIKFIRSLKRLEDKRYNVEGKLFRRDLVVEAQKYTQCSFKHILENKNARRFKSHYLVSYQGFLELETILRASLYQPINRNIPRVSREGIKPPVNKAVERLTKYREEKALLERYIREKPSRVIIKKKKVIAVPVTPTVEPPEQGEEETELAAICLQKLLRGRSLQYEMFQHKENQQLLIQELRTVFGLQSDEQQQLKADAEYLLNLVKQRDEIRKEIARREEIPGRVIYTNLELVFDVLSKELVHFQEERRIRAFVLMAERERRRREAEEGGKRQLEERERVEEDEVFRQLVQVHQESVDLYLEDIILQTLEKVADIQAREEIMKKAKELSRAAFSVDDSQRNLQSEEIVSELVYSFLVPEVDKTNVRRKVHLKQRKHLEAVKSIIQWPQVEAVAKTPSSADPQTNRPSEDAQRTSGGVHVETTSQAEQDKREEQDKQEEQAEQDKQEEQDKQVEQDKQAEQVEQDKQEEQVKEESAPVEQVEPQKQEEQAEQVKPEEQEKQIEPEEEVEEAEQVETVEREEQEEEQQERKEQVETAEREEQEEEQQERKEQVETAEREEQEEEQQERKEQVETAEREEQEEEQQERKEQEETAEREEQEEEQQERKEQVETAEREEQEEEQAEEQADQEEEAEPEEKVEQEETPGETE